MPTVHACLCSQKSVDCHGSALFLSLRWRLHFDYLVRLLCIGSSLLQSSFRARDCRAASTLRCISFLDRIASIPTCVFRVRSLAPTVLLHDLGCRYSRKARVARYFDSALAQLGQLLALLEGLELGYMIVAGLIGVPSLLSTDLVWLVLIMG